MHLASNYNSPSSSSVIKSRASLKPFDEPPPSSPLIDDLRSRGSRFSITSFKSFDDSSVNSPSKASKVSDSVKSFDDFYGDVIHMLKFDATACMNTWKDIDDPPALKRVLLGSESVCGVRCSSLTSSFENGGSDSDSEDDSESDRSSILSDEENEDASKENGFEVRLNQKADEDSSFAGQHSINMITKEEDLSNDDLIHSHLLNRDSATSCCGTVAETLTDTVGSGSFETLEASSSDVKLKISSGANKKKFAQLSIADIQKDLEKYLTQTVPPTPTRNLATIQTPSTNAKETTQASSTIAREGLSNFVAPKPLGKKGRIRKSSASTQPGKNEKKKGHVRKTSGSTESTADEMSTQKGALPPKSNRQTSETKVLRKGILSSSPTSIVQKIRKATGRVLRRSSKKNHLPKRGDNEQLLGNGRSLFEDHPNHFFELEDTWFDSSTFHSKTSGGTDRTENVSYSLITY